MTVTEAARTACENWIAEQVRRGRRLRDTGTEEVYAAGFVTGFRAGRGGLVQHEWDRLLQMAVNGQAAASGDPAQNEQDSLILRRAYEQAFRDMP